MGNAMCNQKNDESRVAFCIYGYPWTVSSPILNGASLLAEHGYRVEMLVNKRPREPFLMDSERITVRFLWDSAPVDPSESHVRSSRSLKDVLRNITPDTVLQSTRSLRWRVGEARVLCGWLRSMVQYTRWVTGLARPSRYVCIMGFEDTGMIAAAVAGRLTGTPSVYHSLELHLSAEQTTWRGRVCKVLERWAHRRTAFTIIQDEERARLLAEDNGVDPDQMLLVPVATMGNVLTQKTDYLHHKLGIDPDKVIVLYAGGIAQYHMSVELARAAQQWPEDWVLVLHGYLDGVAPVDVEELKGLCGNGRVFLSLDLVPFEELDALIASADIGLALYRNMGPNLFHIASASGKLPQYFKCGLPVVCADFPGLRRLMDQFRCGICVKDETEVAEAVRMILAEYDQYRKRAFECYRSRYDLNAYFGAVRDRIDEFAAARRKRLSDFH